MLKCYLLDDEQNALDALSALLQKKFSNTLEIVGKSTSALLAIVEIETLQPDVLFLDVEMPELNGIDVLKHFPERQFDVIFTTAHEQYALPAIKVEALDYLVKPLSPQDVFDAIQKCINRKKEVNVTQSKLTISSSEGIILVAPQEIIYLESRSNYTHFIFTNRPKAVVSKTLGEFENLLSVYGFFRVHQSYLVNMMHVQSVHNTNGDFAILTSSHRVEISRRKKPEFVLRLKKASMNKP